MKNRVSARQLGVCCVLLTGLSACEAPQARDPVALRRPAAITPAASPPLQRASGEPQPQPVENRRLATLRGLLRASDTVVLASLRSVNNRAQAVDGLRSTLVYEVEESLKGPLPAGARISLRFPAGYNRDGSMAQITDVMEVIQGRPGAVQVGQRFLIFSSRAAYEERVRHEKRAPLSTATQALEVLRLQGDEAQGFGMNALFLRLSEVREMLERSREKQA